MAESSEDLLAPVDYYLKAGLHIGTKYKTKYMSPFIYKVRPDGLSVLNVKAIDERIKVAANFLARYDPEDILVVCRRENGWKAVKLFSKFTGVRVIAGRYRPGLLTNSALSDFTEAKVLFVVDPWPDKNAIMDAVKMGLPIVALCDTNNNANFIDLVIPSNNKGKKSLGLLFWILTKEYLRQRGLLKDEKEFDNELEKFMPQ